MGADVSQAPSAGAFAALDESRVTRFQWKIMFISGMGFFTDAYDLFVIGIVVALLKTQWNLTTPQVSLLNSATLAALAPNYAFLLAAVRSLASASAETIRCRQRS